MYKEQRWKIRYVGKDGAEKNCYPRSEQQKSEQLRVAKEKGIRVIYCKKLYPFSTEKNQHNFMLISNVCSNRIWELVHGESEAYEGEWDKLAELKDKADELFCLPLPVAWVPWETWKEAKEISTMAVIHRQEACIENGHPEWVVYC